MVHIAVLMMVKNETKRLHISLNSVVGFADSWSFLILVPPIILLISAKNFVPERKSLSG